MATTKAQRTALIAMRDMGSPWAYKLPVPNAWGVTMATHRWSASRSRMIDRLCTDGFLTRKTYQSPQVITTEGLEAIVNEPRIRA